jgi:hypothetical protein
MAVTIILPILQDVTPCSFIEVYQVYSSFGGIFCLRLQRRIYLKAGANSFVRNISSVALLGNATNKSWVLDLITIYLDFNSYNYSYSLHKLTTHKPETCLLVQYHFTSYLRCLPLSLFSVSVLTVCWLSPLNSASSSVCFGHLLSGVFLALLSS